MLAESDFASSAVRFELHVALELWQCSIGEVFEPSYVATLNKKFVLGFHDEIIKGKLIDSLHLPQAVYIVVM